jgi:hypothetical protein
MKDKEKKKVLAHIKEDSKEFKKQLADDAKMKKMLLKENNVKKVKS